MKNIIRHFLNKIRGEYGTDLLIKRGLKVGDNFNRQRQCIIDESHCWLITIGNNVTLAPRVHILAHDASTKGFLGYSKIGHVHIGNQVFIGTGSIILPNVTIGNNVIIGAGSVVTKDIPSNTVVAGNPAKIIRSLEDYLTKNKKLMNDCPIYTREWTLNQINSEQKTQMKEQLKSQIGYVE